MRIAFAAKIRLSSYERVFFEHFDTADVPSLMQRFVLSCQVKSPFKKVVERFDERLFLALAPKFPKMVLHRHDAIQDGGEVHLTLQMGPFTQKWHSKLSGVKKEEAVFQFEDHGTQLPFPLKKWHHIHRVEAENDGCIIIDDISFSSGFALLDVLMKPVLKRMFAARAPLYVSYFEQ